MAIDVPQPDLDELLQSYQAAEQARLQFVEQAPKPLSDEDRQQSVVLGRVALNELSKFYEAGGTLSPEETEQITAAASNGSPIDEIRLALMNGVRKKRGDEPLDSLPS